MLKADMSSIEVSKKSPAKNLLGGSAQMRNNEPGVINNESDPIPPVYRVQLVCERKGVPKVVSSPAAAAKVISRFLQSPDREHVVVLMLDVQKLIIGLHTVSVGSLDASIVSTREVFKAPMLANAASVVVAHNHPSGDVSPSREDIEVSYMLYKAGILMGIDVDDQLIIGEKAKYFSFQETGTGPYGSGIPAAFLAG